MWMMMALTMVCILTMKSMIPMVTIVMAEEQAKARAKAKAKAETETEAEVLEEWTEEARVLRRAVMAAAILVAALATATATEPKPTKTIMSYFGNTKPKPGYQPKGLMISLDTL
jgi:hypothetical protein